MPLSRRKDRHADRMHRVQRMVENELQDMCVIREQGTYVRTGDTSTSVAGAQVWPALPATEGPCKIALDTRSETFQIQGHSKRTFRGYVITLPASAGRVVQPNQIISITSSNSQYLAVGTHLVIASVSGETAEGGRRVLAIENQR